VTDSSIWPIVLLSLRVSGTAVLLSLVIGLPLGVWLARLSGSAKKAAWAMIYTGLAMPPVVIGLLVYLLLSKSGPLGFLNWLYTPSAMILAQVLLDVPFVVGITMTTVSGITDELYFQLRALGATERYARWSLLWEARAGLILAIATAMGRSLSEVGAVLMVGGNIEGHTRVLTTAIVLETGRGHFAVALLLGAILLGMACLLNLLIVRFHDGSPA
jgi:tungstate transport system permease protein